MGSSEMDELKSALRSLVVSSPSQMDLRTLMRDYRELVGQPIPLSKFGYRNLRDFIQDRCTDSFVLNGPPHNSLVTLIVPDSLKHIDKFVRKQRLTGRDKLKGKRTSLNAPKTVKKDNYNNSFQNNTDMTDSKTINNKSDEIIESKKEEKMTNNLDVNKSLQTRLNMYKKIKENEISIVSKAPQHSPTSSSSSSSKSSGLSRIQILNNLRKLQQNIDSKKRISELEIIREDVIDPNDPLIGVKISDASGGPLQWSDSACVESVPTSVPMASDRLRVGSWAGVPVRGRLSKCMVLSIEGNMAKVWCPSERVLSRVRVTSLKQLFKQSEHLDSASQLGEHHLLAPEHLSRLEDFRSQLPSQSGDDFKSVASMAHSLIKLKSHFGRKTQC